MAKPIVFYDIPCTTKAKAWSPNTWKTRFSLNVKGIPYKTVWVEYPDIAALCNKIGASPTSIRPDGSPYYTLPVIHDPNTDVVVADSVSIARYLDETYPETHTLIPPQADALIAAFGATFWDAFSRPYDFTYILIPAADAILRPRSEAYFRETREKRLGRLDGLAPPGSEKRAKHWEGTRKGVSNIAGWLEADGREKLLFMGDDVGITYADITIAGFFMWIKQTVGEDTQEWADVLMWDDGRWERFMETFKKYEITDEGEELEL